MNRPPLPTTSSTKPTRRPGQNLASLAPGPRGAVLFPVTPKIPQSQSWILVKCTDVSREGGISKSRRKKAPGNKAPKRAGATPLFGLQSAQKVFEVALARFGSRTQHTNGQKS
jgi:hypothetical protein